jgi:hypothetical protein
LIFSGVSVASAQEYGPWSVGVHYGAINHFKMFADADTDAGSLMAVSYSYDFTNSYTAALELGYIIDNYVLPTYSSPRYVETGTFINIEHFFYLSKTETFSPYLKFGTGLYFVTLFQKTENTFNFSASTTMADISVGIGMDFKVWNMPLNADLTFPAILQGINSNYGSPYIFSLGCRYHFEKLSPPQFALTTFGL